LADLGVDIIMLKLIIKKCDGGDMDWIGLAEDRDSLIVTCGSVNEH